MDSAVQENNMQLSSYRLPKEINAEVFRAYDIRGEVGEHAITSDLAYAIGLAVGTEVLNQKQKTIIVGRDGRTTGLELKSALVAGILETGVDVIDIGLVSSPILYFATYFLSANSGIMVTASHNPKNHNGFKIVINGKTLALEDIQKLYQRIINRDFKKGNGTFYENNITQDYINDILTKIHLQKKLKIVIDCGNGATSIVAPSLFRKLGCEVIELFCQVDGNFPNHPADPSVPENLTDLITAVAKEKADLGLAFDGDGDRVGVVTEKGEIIWPDRQMMLFAEEVLTKNPHATIVFDVKCTNLLSQIIKNSGGNPLMYKTGHSLLKAKMQEIGAPLAGEMSGHIFFKDNWYGFDDGVYVGARLLSILSQQTKSIGQVFANYPNSINTPELKVPMLESQKPVFMQKLLKAADFGEVERITIDGLRVDFGYGWGLIRCSNTSPYLILRFEADTQNNLHKIQEVFRKELLKLEPQLELPF